MSRVWTIEKKIWLRHSDENDYCWKTGPTTFGMTTLSITTLNMMKLSITTLNMMKLNITTFSITAFSKMKLSITTFSKMKLSITTFSKMSECCYADYLLCRVSQVSRGSYKRTSLFPQKPKKCNCTDPWQIIPIFDKFSTNYSRSCCQTK